MKFSFSMYCWCRWTRCRCNQRKSIKSWATRRRILIKSFIPNRWNVWSHPSTRFTWSLSRVLVGMRVSWVSLACPSLIIAMIRRIRISQRVRASPWDNFAFITGSSIVTCVPLPRMLDWRLLNLLLNLVRWDRVKLWWSCVVCSRVHETWMELLRISPCLLLACWVCLLSLIRRSGSLPWLHALWFLACLDKMPSSPIAAEAEPPVFVVLPCWFSDVIWTRPLPIPELSFSWKISAFTAF